MSAIKFGIVVFPGSNCDRDCFHAAKAVLGEKASYVWHKEKKLDRFDCVILPGGFSYGDYLRTGAIARFSPVMRPLIDFADSGKTVIGICNGFQILLEAGLLPGAMLRNTNLHFICKYVYLKTETKNTRFTSLCGKRKTLKMPIAHNEGNYYIDKEGLEKLKKNKQIVFRYCDREGNVNKTSNPNGALENIAGIMSEKGNVLGMMPHPERCSEAMLGTDDGKLIFDSIVKWLRR